MYCAEGPGISNVVNKDFPVIESSLIAVKHLLFESQPVFVGLRISCFFS